MSESIPTTGEIRHYWSIQSAERASTRAERASRRVEHAAEFNRWLAEHDREVKAEAWDEGFEAGQEDAYGSEASLRWNMPHTCITNPYREETE